MTTSHAGDLEPAAAARQASALILLFALNGLRVSEATGTDIGACCTGMVLCAQAERPSASSGIVSSRAPGA